MLTYEGYMGKLPDEITGMWQRQTWVKNTMTRGLSLPEAYADEAAVFEAANELSALETEALRFIVAHFGSSPFILETLTARSGMRMTGAELEIGLIGLRRRGIVCTFRKIWGELLFSLPWDGFCVWRERLEDNGEMHAADQVCLTSAESPPFSAGLAQDMFALLSLAAREEVPITVKGALTKRHIHRFGEAVKMPRGPLADCGLQYALCDVYDPALAVALDMTMRLGLLAEVGGSLRLQADKLSAWLGLETEGQQAVLYRQWIELRLPEEGWLQHAVALIESFPPGRMFSADTVVESVRLSGASSDMIGSSMAERLRTEWCAPLAALGFIEENIDANGRVLYTQRFARQSAQRRYHDGNDQEKSKEGGCIYVQPDFELIVPPTAPLAVCWEAAMLGETIEWNDDCLRITLTKESFFAAYRLGRTTESSLQFLSRHALYGVPDNVSDAIRGWGASFGKARIFEAALLHCADAETAEAVAASQRCAPFIQSRIAPDLFVVRSDAVAAITKELGKIGIVPGSLSQADSGSGAGLPDMTVPLETDLQASAAKYFGTVDPSRRGLIMARNPGIHYQPDTRVPAYDDAYAGLGDVPALWFSELRAYHSSTRKEIIRKAIEWRSYVKLRKEGAERTVVPQTLSEVGERWSILGFERGMAESDPIREVRLESDEWEEMQLILPGKE